MHLHAGSTRVVALANWPGHLPAGVTVNEMIHVVDRYPTLARLAGASTAKCKPLDGLDVWPTVSEGKPSPRTELVYNVEPFRAAVRQGDWKLVWRATLPQSIELYNIPQDPSEKTNLAAQYPEKVTALQKHANELAAEAAKPMLLEVGFKSLLHEFHLPPGEQPRASALTRHRRSAKTGPSDPMRLGTWPTECFWANIQEH